MQEEKMIFEEPAVKRKRGRPRKEQSEMEEEEVQSSS